MYVTLCFWIFSFFLCMAEYLDNPLVTTGLEQLPLRVLPTEIKKSRTRISNVGKGES